jgi:sirohydrochlorin ferrochelatase
VHGSRDVDYQLGVKKLTELVTQNLINISKSKTINNNKSPLIETAFLELSSLSLANSLIDFALKCIAQNCQNVNVIPLFLLTGIHQKKDIPKEVKIAQEKLQILGKKINIELKSPLGSYDSLINILEQKFAEFPTQNRLLLVHGSSLKSANKQVEKIAFKLNADLAFWSIKPSLKEKIVNLIKVGLTEIAILPYFLFEGKITKAIASEIEELKLKYPYIQLSYLSPLGDNIDLANLIVKEL